MQQDIESLFDLLREYDFLESRTVHIIEDGIQLGRKVDIFQGKTKG